MWMNPGRLKTLIELFDRQAFNSISLLTSDPEKYAQVIAMLDERVVFTEIWFYLDIFETVRNFRSLTKYWWPFAEGSVHEDYFIANRHRQLPIGQEQTLTKSLDGQGEDMCQDCCYLFESDAEKGYFILHLQGRKFRNNTHSKLLVALK